MLEEEMKIFSYPQKKIWRMNKMEGNKPEKKFSTGLVEATVWKNIKHLEEGKDKEFRTITFNKSYKNSENEWKTTNSLNTPDIPKAIVVLSKAYEYLILKGEKVEA
jgi:hypothetical protein